MRICIRVFYFFVAICVLSSSVGSPLFAQTHGSLSGTVADPSGAPVAGTTVTLNSWTATSWWIYLAVIPFIGT